jgi:hypothetical protein
VCLTRKGTAGIDHRPRHDYGDRICLDRTRNYETRETHENCDSRVNSPRTATKRKALTSDWVRPQSVYHGTKPLARKGARYEDYTWSVLSPRGYGVAESRSRASCTRRPSLLGRPSQLAIPPLRPSAPAQVRTRGRGGRGGSACAEADGWPLYPPGRSGLRFISGRSDRNQRVLRKLRPPPPGLHNAGTGCTNGGYGWLPGA